MKTPTILAATFAIALAGGVFAQAAEHAEHQQSSATTQPTTKPANTICPVTGEEINPAITTTYQGKTVAFCCKDCIEAFEKNPDKYMKKLK